MASSPRAHILLELTGSIAVDVGSYHPRATPCTTPYLPRSTLAPLSHHPRAYPLLEFRPRSYVGWWPPPSPSHHRHPRITIVQPCTILPSRISHDRCVRDRSVNPFSIRPESPIPSQTKYLGCVRPCRSTLLGIFFVVLLLFSPKPFFFT